jgi:hypothetical protein
MRRGYRGGEIGWSGGDGEGESRAREVRVNRAGELLGKGLEGRGRRRLVQVLSGMLETSEI